MKVFSLKVLRSSVLYTMTYFANVKVHMGINSPDYHYTLEYCPGNTQIFVG
jgi:spore germination protein YaaH